MTEEEREAQRSPLNQAMALAPGLDPKRLAEATGLDEDDARRVRDAVLDALGMSRVGLIVKYYEFRFEYWGWAKVYLSAEGRVTILSDWGHYSYYWSHHSCPSVAHWIAKGRNKVDGKPDYSYLLSKFAPRKVVDDTRTVAAIRRDILESRRGRSLDAEEAREEWRLAQMLEEGDCDVREWCDRTSLEDAAELVKKSHELQAQQCIEHVWPALVAAIRKDLGLNERGESAAEVTP